MSFDEKSGYITFKDITHLISNTDQYNLIVISLANGETITATSRHPFYMSNKTWKDADEIIVGDFLFNGQDQMQKVIRVETSLDLQTVYNITVRDYHTYFVSESRILVHNANQTCKFRGIRARGYDWSHILERHSANGM